MRSALDIFERAHAPASPPRGLGILYAEDFDDGTGAAAPDLAPDAPPLTEQDVDHARLAAVAAARAEWEASAQRRRTELLASISTALAEAQDEAGRIALAAAEGTATTFLAMLCGVLPRLCRDHGAGEVRAITQQLLPLLRSEPRITVRVHADLVAMTERDVATLEPDLAGTVSVLAAPLALGDVKVTWENGSFTRTGEQVRAAMQDALSLLGLHNPVELLPERRMALAE